MRHLTRLMANLMLIPSVVFSATSVTTRSGAGRSLTWLEMDRNITNLRDSIDTNAANLGGAIATLMQSQSAGVRGYQTKAAMDMDLTPAANTMAIVTNDATAANNTYYIKIGGSGSGSWQKSNLASGPRLINASLYADFATAVAAQGSTPSVIVVSDAMTVAASINTAPHTIWILPGGRLSPGSGVTLTIPSLVDCDYTIFSGTGSVVGMPLARPEMWGAVSGAVCSAAVQSAVASGGHVVLSAGKVFYSKNIAISTQSQMITVDGVLAMPASSANNDSLLTASSVNNVRIVGSGVLDGNASAQSGAISQHIITATDCNGWTVGDGLTVRKNYCPSTNGGEVAGWAIKFTIASGTSNHHVVRNLRLEDWGREGIYLDEASYSAIEQVVAYDSDGNSWSAVQMSGATSTRNRIMGVTTYNTGGSAVGCDSTYSVITNIVVDTVRYQHGVNLGHTGKPASHSVVGNVVVKNILDPSNAYAAGVSVAGASENVYIHTVTVDGSTQRGVNIGSGAQNISLSGIVLKGVSCGLCVYQSARVEVQRLRVRGSVGTGILKDSGVSSGYTSLILDTVDLTAATTKISGAAAGMLSPYISLNNTQFNSAELLEGGVSIAALGAGGTVTITNSNARSNSRIILISSNAAGASALPFIQTQNDGSFVIQTANNGGGGAYVRWKII